MERRLRKRKKTNDSNQADLEKRRHNLTEQRNEYEKALILLKDETEKTIQLNKNETEKAIKLYKEKYNKINDEVINDFNSYFKSREQAYPWLADKLSDFLVAEGLQDAEEHLNTHNMKKIERGWKLTDYRKLIKELEKQNIILSYQINDLLESFPKLEEYVETDPYELQIEDDSNYLSEQEWELLSDSEKNQLILDRYIEKTKKSKWVIGSLFESYVGYHYEQLGYDVEYYGIERKLEDLGRDLIAKNKNEILIVQCKYWSKEKQIREKHICQLFGTTMAYKNAHPEEKRSIYGVFVCHNTLSDTARDIAKYLRIQIQENLTMEPLPPLIKCNLETNIYHLPTDDNYWKIMTEKTKEKFKKVSTVKEAEALGCRRTFKWHGNKFP